MLKAPDNKWTESPKKRGWFSGIRSFFTTVLLLAALLYGGIYIIGLMDGFRASLEDHLRADLDLKAKISKAWLTPALNLRFEGLATVGYGRSGYPGVQIENGFLEWSVCDYGRWHWPRLRRGVLNGCGVSFAPNDRGLWEPVPLASLGQQVADWCGFAVAVPLPEKPPPPILNAKPSSATSSTGKLLDELRQTLLEITDAKLVWWDADGREMARAEKLRMALTPLMLPSREIKHCWLRIDEASLTDGRSARDIRCEFFDLGTQKLMLEFRADWMHSAKTNTTISTH